MRQNEFFEKVLKNPEEHSLLEREMARVYRLSKSDSECRDFPLMKDLTDMKCFDVTKFLEILLEADVWSVFIAEDVPCSVAFGIYLEGECGIYSDTVTYNGRRFEGTSLAIQD